MFVNSKAEIIELLGLTITDDTTGDKTYLIHVGDIIKVSVASTVGKDTAELITIEGRVSMVGTNVLTLDASEQYKSSVGTIYYNDIRTIEVIKSEYGSVAGLVSATIENKNGDLIAAPLVQSGEPTIINTSSATNSTEVTPTENLISGTTETQEVNPTV